MTKLRVWKGTLSWSRSDFYTLVMRGFLHGAMLTFVISLASADEARGSDVRYIKCDTCEALIEAILDSVASEKRNSKKKLSEERLGDIVERVCKPETDEGAWLRSIDLVEAGDKLRLQRQTEDGPCGTECRTLQLACGAVVEGIEDELAAALFAPQGDDLRESACKELSNACRKPPPPLPSGRQPGPPFRPFTDEERAQRERERGTPPPPGVLSASALRFRLGLSGSPADDEHRASQGAQGQAGAMGFPRDESAGGVDEESIGRGMAVGNLERSSAFVEL